MPDLICFKLVKIKRKKEQQVSYKQVMFLSFESRNFLLSLNVVAFVSDDILLIFIEILSFLLKMFSC